MITGTIGSVPNQKTLLPNYFSGHIHQVDDHEFAALLGRPLPDNNWPETITENMPLRQLHQAKGWLARLIFLIIENQRIAKEKSGTPDLETMFIYNLPYRGMTKLTQGQVGPGMVDGLLLALNGHFFRGLGRFVIGYFTNWAANRRYARLLRRQAKKGEGA